ncbi:MAG: DUF6268 family outer membrane beta-barrel protein [Planctomycetota bacterium]|nr:DUF6268 family outer membrane beta-barrel protein [Planctomycetota bacterium]
MRYQIPRFVLAAGLGVASAIAQAPATSTPNYAQHGESVGARHSDPALSLRAPVAWPELRGGPTQGEGDYSVTALFREAHGEFMDRRERYDPSIEFRGRWLPNQRIKGEPGDFDLLGLDFDAEFPIVVYPDAYLLFGLYHQSRRYQTSTLFGSNGNTGNSPAQNNAENAWGDETVTAAGVRVGLGLFLNDYVLLEVETNPGVYSDMERTLTHKDYDFPSSALMTVQATNDFFFKFGLRYNQVYEDAPWLPWLGFGWDMGDGWRLDVMLPEYFELAYWPTGSTAFTFGTQVQGAQYSVRTVAGGERQRANINVQEVFSYLGLTHRMTDNMSFNARAGAVLAGQNDLTTGARAFRRTSGALDQGFYADFTIGIDW